MPKPLGQPKVWSAEDLVRLTRLTRQDVADAARLWQTSAKTLRGLPLAGRPQ